MRGGKKFALLVDRYSLLWAISMLEARCIKLQEDSAEIRD